MKNATRRGRPRSSAKRAAITGAARAAFMAGGYHGATMDEIAQAAGASKATLYSHFADKPELFRTVILAEIDSLHAAYADTRWNIAAPKASLREFAAKLLRFLTSDEARALSRVTIATIDRFPELGEEFYAQGMDHTQGVLAGFIATCDERGTLRCARSEEAAAQFIGELVGLPLLRSLLGVNSQLSPSHLSRHVKAVVGHFIALYEPADR